MPLEMRCRAICGGHAAGLTWWWQWAKQIDQKRDEEVEPRLVTHSESFGSNSRAPGLLTTDPAPVPLEMVHLNLHTNPSVQTVGHMILI